MDYRGFFFGSVQKGGGTPARATTPWWIPGPYGPQNWAAHPATALQTFARRGLPFPSRKADSRLYPATVSGEKIAHYPVALASSNVKEKLASNKNPQTSRKGSARKLYRFFGRGIHRWIFLWQGNSSEPRWSGLERSLCFSLASSPCRFVSSRKCDKKGFGLCQARVKQAGTPSSEGTSSWKRLLRGFATWRAGWDGVRKCLFPEPSDIFLGCTPCSFKRTVA